MKKKQQIQRAEAIVLILILIAVCTGCQPTNSTEAELAHSKKIAGIGNIGSMIDEELLTTLDAVNLLNRNGIALSRSLDFPVDLSRCKIYGEEPQPYFSSETGVYYMFYQYEDYSTTTEFQNQMGFYDYPGCAKEFSDYVFPGCAGKNLAVCIYYPDLINWINATSEEERKEAEEHWRTVYKEGSSVADILNRKVFNQKSLVLIGQSENWEVVVPVSYMLNQMKNKDGNIESQLRVENSTFYKYKKSDGEPPRVSTIRIEYDGSGGSRSWTDGTLLAEKETGYGFYKTDGSGASRFNPQYSDGITITITWGENGQTEEIQCRKQGPIPLDLLGKIPMKNMSERHLEKEII